MNPIEKVEKYEGIFTDFPQRMPTAGVPDGPLFGNGDLGIAAGGSGDALTLWLSKNDCWYATYRHQGRDCINGCQGLGTLKLCSPALKDAAFLAKQKMASADVEIDLENAECHLHVTGYAPYQQSLIILKVQSQKGNIPLRISLSPLADEDADYSQKTIGNRIYMTKDYLLDAEWETKAAAVCRIMDWKRTEQLLCEGEQITIAVAVYTNHDTPEYQSAAESAVAGLSPKLLEDYRRQHLDWWQAFWNTSGISIPGEPEIEAFWYASHYLMACCSKGGKFAPGLFGNWITTNRPNWNGDYHLNYNYQAPWWAVYSSNKVSLSDPYDQPLLDYIPQARKNARTQLNCRGIFSKVGIGPKGLESSRMFHKDGTEDETLPYWGQKSNAAYAAVNILMRFYSTWDAAYAQKYALPYLLEVADFWEDYLRFEDGRYVIYQDCIHENGSDRPEDFNPILTLGLLRIVFRGLLDITDYLNVQKKRQDKWAHILTHLSAFPTQTREGKTVFRYTERGMDWCDGNSLGIQHIYPCGAIGLSSDEALLNTAKNTIAVMNRWADYNAFPTFFTAAARVGYDPKIIIEKFKEQFLNHSFPNFFIYYGGGGIECCSTVPGCINEMLFQSHEEILRFFPTWEKEKDAAFYGRLSGNGRPFYDTGISFFHFQNFFIIKFRFFLQFLVQRIVAILFCQRFSVGKQIRSKAEPVAFNLHAQSRQRGGEHVKSSKLSIFLSCRGYRSIDNTVINCADVVFIHFVQKSSIHCQMVTAYYDCRVFIKRLLLNPFYELIHLFGRTVQYIRILFLISIAAPQASVSVREMGIHSKHGEIEGFFFTCQTSQFFFCKSKKLLILKSPPHHIILRQTSLFFQRIDIHNLIISMLGNIRFSAMEFRIRPHQQRLIVALFFQNFSNGNGSRQKIISGTIGILIGRHLHFDGYTAGLCGHRRSRPCGAGKGKCSSHALCIGKTYIFLCKHGQFRNIIRCNRSPRFGV